jgi:hypothetical protein
MCFRQARARKETEFWKFCGHDAQGQDLPLWYPAAG